MARAHISALVCRLATFPNSTLSIFFLNKRHEVQAYLTARERGAARRSVHAPPARDAQLAPAIGWRPPRRAPPTARRIRVTITSTWTHSHLSHTHYIQVRHK